MDCDDDLDEMWTELLHPTGREHLVAARLLGEVVTLRRLCSNLEVELSRLYQLVRDERRTA